MDTEKVTLLKQKIEDAELVLVGIGEEWEIKRKDYEKNQQFADAVEILGANHPMIPFFKKVLLDMEADEVIKERKKQYKQIAALIKEKNYFVVSLCEDGLPFTCGLNCERMVSPCGTFEKMQCSEGCHTELFAPDREWLTAVKEYLLKGVVSIQGADELLKKAPVCPECGKPLIFNTISAENYLEEGYLPKWQLYTKWLQGTVNKKVCILELGVGMRFPTVIRWPFEKIAFFNQKASFFRVHSMLYQTTEEIKEKSYGIQAAPDEFIQELSGKN